MEDREMLILQSEYDRIREENFSLMAKNLDLRYEILKLKEEILALKEKALNTPTGVEPKPPVGPGTGNTDGGPGIRRRPPGSQVGDNGNVRGPSGRGTAGTSTNGNNSLRRIHGPHVTETYTQPVDEYESEPQIEEPVAVDTSDNMPIANSDNIRGGIVRRPMGAGMGHGGRGRER